MKLNPECIRDIMRSIGDSEDDMWEYPHKELNEYDPDTVIYHLKQCRELGYVYQMKLFFGPAVVVR